MSRYILKLSLEYSEFEKRDDAHSQSAYPELASQEVVLGNTHEAIQYGVLAKKFFTSANAFGKESNQSDYLADFAKITDLSKIKFSEEHYRKAEEKLLYIIFIPLFCKLIGSDLHEDRLLQELEQCKAELLSMKLELFLINDWFRLLEHFKQLVLFWKSDGNVDNDFTLFNNRSSFELFSVLLGSEKSNVVISNAYISHVRVAISLPDYSENAKFMFLGIGRFIHRYWLRIAQTRRFALRYPDLFTDTIMAISPHNGADTIYDVLISAGQAVNIRLNDNVMTQMKRLKRMAKPWQQN